MMVSSPLTFATTQKKPTHFNITLMDYPGALERYGEPLTKAYKSLGISVEFTTLGNGISLKDTNNGKFDADLMRAEGPSDTLSNLLPVGKALAVANIVVLCQKNIPCNNELLKLASTQVHSVSGAKSWNKAIAATQATVSYQQSLTELKQLFIEKKINYMVYTLDDAGFFSADDLNANVMEKPLLTLRTFHYIHKKHRSIINDLALAINREFSKLL